MSRTTRTLPHPGRWGLSLPALLRRVPALLFLVAALLTVTLAACGGNEEEKGSAATATSPPAAMSNTPAPQVNTPVPPANETGPGGIETAARKVLADELEVDEGDFRLVTSEPVGWSDASLGCPMPGFMYAQVLTPGHKLIFDLAGTPYAMHTNDDGTNAVVCWDDSGTGAPADAVPTPKAQMGQGAESGTQEYAEALEEAFSGRDDEIEDAAKDLFGGTLFTSDELQRISSIENADSWSEEDAAFMSEYAETILEAVTGFYDIVLGALKGGLDEIAGLRPPGHLSDLHDNLVESFGEGLRFTQEHVDIVSAADTDIRSREDLASFQALIDSLESGPLDPELAQQLEDATEELEEACLALRDQLEAELEHDVNICE